MICMIKHFSQCILEQRTHLLGAHSLGWYVSLSMVGSVWVCCYTLCYVSQCPLLQRKL